MRSIRSNDIKHLDAKIAHWAATDKAHKAELARREWLYQNDPRYIADRESEDARADWILKHRNHV